MSHIVQPRRALLVEPVRGDEWKGGVREGKKEQVFNVEEKGK